MRNIFNIYICQFVCFFEISPIVSDSEGCQDRKLDYSADLLDNRNQVFSLDNSNVSDRKDHSPWGIWAPILRTYLLLSPKRHMGCKGVIHAI